ncbi:uncharacterized protein KD926_004450 [Aspergillus affinis]|uniref:uncharacterized protein n=1 Tax=Aspergillus affinis TaxID=1070780 RepID=UPI0022FEB419|nr:uncharacterized protein KD926_004450 [Aspergillus affinis]KAI9035178.1 hypothetical protein KD926_004450 [Aspergillus affinis]
MPPLSAFPADRQPNISKGKRWYLETLGMTDPREQEQVRNMLERFSEEFAPMRNPRKYRAKSSIERHLRDRIEEFPLFIRTSFAADADRAIGLLYQVFIKGQNTWLKKQDSLAVAAGFSVCHLKRYRSGRRQRRHESESNGVNVPGATALAATKRGAPLALTARVQYPILLTMIVAYIPIAIFLWAD